jgi:hypothetical protein
MRVLLTCLLTASLVFPPVIGFGQDRHELSSGPSYKSRLTLEMLDQRVHELAAKYHPQYGKLPRVIDYDIAYPSTPEEYGALNKHAVVLLTALTQDAAELPLKRVFLHRDGAEDLNLDVLAVFYAPTDNDPLVRETLGPIRAEVFCLLPVARTFADSTLQVDFAKTRTGFVVARFPQSVDEDFIMNDKDRNPSPHNRVSPEALKVLLAREFPDFEVEKFWSKLP